MVHAEAVSRALSLAELAAPRPERARQTSRMRQRRRSRTWLKRGKDAGPWDVALRTDVRDVVSDSSARVAV